jgi:erythromycin esterase-like protein
MAKLNDLQDSLSAYKDFLVASSSEKEFDLQARILRLTEQVSEVRYAIRAPQGTTNYRDKYMAENTAWLSEYFKGENIVVWAHNWHISDYGYGNTGTMGNYLSNKLGDEYATIGFLFSQGTFTAVGMEGDQYTEVATQTLDTIPIENSLNAIMSYTQEPAFSIELRRLQAYTNWFIAFNDDMEYFSMGAVYNNEPGDYYSHFDPFFFDYLIYFDRSTASVPLN